MSSPLPALASQQPAPLTRTQVAAPETRAISGEDARRAGDGWDQLTATLAVVDAAIPRAYEARRTLLTAATWRKDQGEDVQHGYKPKTGPCGEALSQGSAELAGIRAPLSQSRDAGAGPASRLFSPRCLNCGSSLDHDGDYCGTVCAAEDRRAMREDDAYDAIGDLE